MSLIDELRESIAGVPPSHIPAPAEALAILGALICHAELGERFLEAAKVEDPAERTAAIDALLAPPEPEQPATVQPPTTSTVQAPGNAAAGDQVAELRAQNAQLQQQVQTLLANQERTQVEVTPGTAPTEGPAA